MPRSRSLACLGVLAALPPLAAQSPEVGQRKKLIYHDIRTGSDGNIVPWYSDEPGTAYDHVLGLVWRYWRLMPNYWTNSPAAYRERYGATAGVRKYMVQRTLDDIGIGGDQVAMVLDSWSLYYAYTGDPEIVENMRYQADMVLADGLSKPGDAWPNLPYPCNTTNMPIYDGDLIAGKGFTQPDKAGSLGLQLVTLYKITGDAKYLNAARGIADTLAAKVSPGDADHSPLPFRVHAVTGQVRDPYTTNWAPTMELMEALIALKQGNAAAYAAARATLLSWMKQYPLQTNRWGPFFEDIKIWSDTEINAGTFARYILTHSSDFVDAMPRVRNIQEWVIATLSIPWWQKYGLVVIGEQTAYKMQGNSHTARHASIEMLYAELTGDLRYKPEAIRQLNWATYMVDVDGKNWYPNFEVYEIWWTDGYGDYVRHYLRSMASAPELAPPGQNHMLRTTSVCTSIRYQPGAIEYRTFDGEATELFRLAAQPREVTAGGRKLTLRKSLDSEGYMWQPMKQGGVLKVRHDVSPDVRLIF